MPRVHTSTSIKSSTGQEQYSVSARAVGRPVEIRAYADRIELRQDGRAVGDHRRCFERDQTVFDPWHYVPVLARKPGALRNGAPFKDWVLPAGLKLVRRKLAGVADGDRQMVKILTTVLSDGLPAVEAACLEALRGGVHSADVTINILGPAPLARTADHDQHAGAAAATSRARRRFATDTTASGGSTDGAFGARGMSLRAAKPKVPVSTQP